MAKEDLVLNGTPFRNPRVAQADAIGEGSVPDAAERLWQRECGKTLTEEEGFVPDCLERRRQLDTAELAAVCETSVPDGDGV